MTQKEVVDKIIASHAIGVFASENVPFYDRKERLPEAIQNGIYIVDAQISMVNEGAEMYIIEGTEGTDLNFWNSVKEKIKDYKYE